jgi:glycosyltransferase involved in cell wall biosynthesis
MSRMMGFLHDQLAEAGDVVDYFCADDVSPRLNGRLPRRFAFPLLVWREARAAARSGRPYDIINVHEPSASVVAALGRAGLPGAVVVTSHGVERRAWSFGLEELRRGREGPSLKTRLVYPATVLSQARLGLRRADHVFCLSTEDRDYLIGRVGLRGERVTRIYPGAGRVYAEAAAGRNYRRAERLLFAGTWRKNKGIEDIVPAFAELAGRHPGLRLVVLGGGEGEPDLRSMFPEAVRARVSCMTTAGEGENATAFATADLYVLPSLFEGTPLTLIEAMMSGMPIVTTATCGMRDVVEDGMTGLLVPIRSPAAIVRAVEALVADAGLRERIGRAAQKKALESYTWDRVAGPVKSVYERLAGRRQRHGQPA